MMPMGQAAASLLCGSLAGFTLGLIGGGGSMLAMPLLFYVVGVGDPHVAIGTGATAVCVAALFNVLTHARAGHVRWRHAAIFALVGVAGALGGSSLGKSFDGHRLLALFGMLMLVVGVLMLRSRDGASRADRVGRSGALAGLALPAGMLSGFFGIGGGFLIVPCLLYATGMPVIDAIGSSLLSVATFSMVTALNYARSGLVVWGIAAWFIGGGLLGGIAGMRCATVLCKRKNLLRRIFAGVLFAVAAYIFFRSYGASR